jgi:hypothetical protein
MSLAQAIRDGGPELVIRRECPLVAMPVLSRRGGEIGEPVAELEWQEVDDAIGPWPGGLPPTTPPDPELIGVERVLGVVGSAIDCRGAWSSFPTIRGSR